MRHLFIRHLTRKTIDQKDICPEDVCPERQLSIVTLPIKCKSSGNEILTLAKIEKTQ
jgi:hypothetical protein